jgi:hypothetical protein
VTRIHKESIKATITWDIVDQRNEREELVILKLGGFADNDALSKAFVVGVSQRFPDLRLDADSVRSPISPRQRKGKVRMVMVPHKLYLMDYERLHKGEWFNDRVIQFWKWWLQHGPSYDRKEVDYYDSVQFAKVGLKGNGDSVRATLNPFDKKMVLIPLNFSRAHWNLAVLLNLDAMKVGGGKDLNSPMPCMLFLDSMRCDKSGTDEHREIVAWLQRKEPTLDITKETIPLFVPPVVQQQDTNSCGPLSILNAYCMIRLHKQAFTYEYAGVNLEGQRLKGCGTPFGDMVEKSLEFCYSVHDVDRMLGEMRCIVNELSTKQRDHI